LKEGSDSLLFVFYEVNEMEDIKNNLTISINVDDIDKTVEKAAQLVKLLK
jgi:hypothetical protein